MVVLKQSKKQKIIIGVNKMSNRPDYKIVLQADHIKRLEEEIKQLKEENETLRQFLSKEPLALQALQSAYSDYKKRSEVFSEMIKELKEEIEQLTERNNNK